MRRRKITVLVVDDSAFMRKALKRMLNSDPGIRVLGDAADGIEAVKKVKRLRPDVVTLDVKMAKMDGIEALKIIMRERPTPVLMISSLTSEGGGVTLQALAAGAADFIDKSACHTTLDILEIADSLVEKVKVLAGVDVKKLETRERPEPVAPPPPPLAVSDGVPSHLVTVGASTGGPMALEKILTALPGDYPGAVLVVQHIPNGFTRSLAERMNTQCAMEVLEAKEDDLILPRHVYIAPGGYHLRIRRSGDRFHALLSRRPRDAQHIPSVDELMKSVAETWPGPMLGIILTGMGSDGSEGVKAIKERGGTTLAQNEDTCVVFGMPKAAYHTGCVDRFVALGRVANEICQFR